MSTESMIKDMEIMSHGSFSALVLCDDKYYLTLSSQDKHKIEYFDDIESGMLQHPWCPVVRKVDRPDIVQFVNEKAPHLDMMGYAELAYEIEFLRKYPDNLTTLKKVACTINGLCGTRWYSKDFDDCLHELESLCNHYDDRLFCTGSLDIPKALDYNKLKVGPHTPIDDVQKIKNVMWRGDQFVIVDPFYTLEND